jgi:hypothetical protein
MQLNASPATASHGAQGWPRLCFVLILLATLAAPGLAWSADISDLPTQFQEKIELARKACSEVNNGEFALEWGSVERIDLDGDLRPDWVLNEASFACSSVPSLYCGTGGCVSHFLVRETIGSLQNQGWKVADMGGHRILVAKVHGSQCGSIGPSPCVTASIWDKEGQQWRSAIAQWE